MVATIAPLAGAAAVSGKAAALHIQVLSRIDRDRPTDPALTVQVPGDHLPVEADRVGRRTVLVEHRRRGDAACVAAQGLPERTRREVPHVDRQVVPRRDERGSVRGERDTLHDAVVTGVERVFGPCRKIDQRDRAVRAADGERPTVVGQRGRVEVVATQPVANVERVRVEEHGASTSVVRPDHGEDLPVARELDPVGEEVDHR